MNLRQLSRFVGAQVCKVKGCRYHYANGCYDSWKAYQCLRCGELDQPLESLQPRPDYIGDDYDEYGSWDEVEEGERLFELDTRWFVCLPFPRWL